MGYSTRRLFSDGTCWEHFPHDHAHRRTYRWGEDGLLGFCDRQCRLCLAPALWNGADDRLKERLFGLTGNEGNHGEDVKEAYFHLAATPTYSYSKVLYKYPQRAFPYQELITENQRRSRVDPEYELEDTGVFDHQRYFDMFVEYAKADDNDLLMRITVHNRGEQAAPLTLHHRYGFEIPGSGAVVMKAVVSNHKCVMKHPGHLSGFHESLGHFDVWARAGQQDLDSVFCENETNFQSLYHHDNTTKYPKDSFHRYIVEQDPDAVNPQRHGSKAAFVLQQELAGGQSITVELRLRVYGEEKIEKTGQTTGQAAQSPWQDFEQGI